MIKFKKKGAFVARRKDIDLYQGDIIDLRCRDENNKLVKEQFTIVWDDAELQWALQGHPKPRVDYLWSLSEALSANQEFKKLGSIHRRIPRAEKSFTEYLAEAREDFVRLYSLSDESNDVDCAVMAEGFILAFDQLRERHISLTELPGFTKWARDMREAYYESHSKRILTSKSIRDLEDESKEGETWHYIKELRVYLESLGVKFI